MFISSSFVVLSNLSDFEHFSKHFLCLGHNSQSAAQSYYCLKGAFLVKLVSAIFYQVFISHQMIAFQKL